MFCIKNIWTRLEPVYQHLKPYVKRAGQNGQVILHQFKQSSWQGRSFAVILAGTTLYVAYSNNRILNAVEKKKKLVILGSGWGAVSLIKSLKPGQYDVTVVSPTNYFLFTPLLPSVTVGTVDGRTLVEPIRKIIKRKHKGNDVQYFEAECTDVDSVHKEVTCQDKSGVTGETSEFKLNYDVLVVAVGSKTATYNKEDIEKYAHKLKTIQQAQEIRKNIMDAFETAAIPGQPEQEIKRLLNFVVVGGGPTGVEFAGELRDFVENLKKLYPPDLIDSVTVTLVNSHYKVLSMYDQEISHFVEKKFKSSGVDVIGGCYVVGMDDKTIFIKNKQTKEVTSLPYGMCVWAAGIAPREITKTMIAKIRGQRNRNALVTDAFLNVKNTENIFGIGDCATVEFTKLLKNIENLYKQADADGNGELKLDEFEAFLDNVSKTYPEMNQHFNKMKKSVHKTFATLDANNDQTLSLEEFKIFLSDVDNKLKSYPATAQVASQQGKYVATLLNKHPEILEGDHSSCVPFTYNHLGSFAYVGGERAVLQLPVIGSLTGWATMWLWRAAYLNQAVSWRMEFLIALDWMKAHALGRDTSRI